MINRSKFHTKLGTLNTIDDVVEYYKELRVQDREYIKNLISAMYYDNTTNLYSIEEAIVDYKDTIKFDKREANASLLKYLLILDKDGEDIEKLIKEVKDVEASDLVNNNKAKQTINITEVEDLIRHYHSSIVAEIKLMMGDLSKSPLEEKEKEDNIEEVMSNLRKRTNSIREEIAKEKEESKPEVKYTNSSKYIYEEDVSIRPYNDLLIMHIARLVLTVISIFVSFMCSFFSPVAWISSIVAFILLNGVAFSVIYQNILKPKSDTKIHDILRGSAIFSSFYILSQLISYTAAVFFLIPVFQVVSYYIYKLLVKPQVKFDSVGKSLDFINSLTKRGDNHRRYKEESSEHYRYDRRERERNYNTERRHTYKRSKQR